MGVGAEPHAEAITTSVISIIEIEDALIFLPPCGISTGVVRSILALSFVLQTKAHSFFVQMVVTSVYQKPLEEHTDFTKMSLYDILSSVYLIGVTGASRVPVGEVAAVVTVELRLLGPPSLIIAGRPARLHSAKALAFLAYLTLEADAPHSRAKLAGLLWGESPDAQARHSLRQVLYSLRRALGNLIKDCLVLEEETVVFEPHPDLRVDALEFLTSAAADSKDLDALRRAAQLYQGMLLEGLELSGCPAFDEWLFFQRDTLEQRALGVHQALVDGLLRRGDYREALTFAQRLGKLDPLHEGAHRHLMQIHAAMGDREGMRRQYRLCADILGREMGVEPAAETQALYQRLASARPAPSAPAERPPPPPSEEQSLALPFLGRERELAALQVWLCQAIARQGGLLLVVGEAGMGKTRLVAEFIRRSTEASAVPVRYLSGQCYDPEARAPYAVWADVLQPLSRSDWQSLLAGLAEVWHQQLARLVPELGSPTDSIEGTTVEESRLRLLQGVVQSLICLTQSCTLLLWFDDLHWADEASLELLHYVSRHVAAYPLLIIGTYRPEAAADTLYFDHLLRGTGHAAAPSVLRLTPLDQETIGQMLMHLGTEWPADLPSRLYQHSDGNPFLLVETLYALVESGKLRREPDGHLVEAEAKSWPVPRRVQDLIQARLAPLGEERRRVLAAGAVIGRPFGLRFLRWVSGLPELRLLDAVEQLLERAFFDEKTGILSRQLLDFHHDYFRRVVYEGLSAVQRRALHRRAARALLALHRARSKAVTEEVAYHYEQAGDLEAVPHLTQAAQQAEELFAYHHATELYNRALTLHRAYLADDLAGRFDLILAREAVLDRQGRRSEQADDIAALLELAEALGDTHRLAEAGVRQAGFFTYTGQYAQARQAGERALDFYRRAGDRAGEARALRELGFLHWSADDYGTALSYGRDALQLHRRLGEVEGEATALHNLAEIYRSLGSPRQALTQYESALNLHWARQDRQRQGLTLYGMAHALRQLGDLDQALTRYQQALAHFETAGDRLMISRVQHALAGLQWEAGAPDQAFDHMQQALEISREIGYGPGIAHGLIVLSDIQARCRRVDIACEHLQEAVTWLHLTEDQAGLIQAQTRLHALERGSPEAMDSPMAKGWVRSHVALAEGKVYCEFESPMAGQRL
jgi:DNA-binding SARP family transcriptional activator